MLVVKIFSGAEGMSIGTTMAGVYVNVAFGTNQYARAAVRLPLFPGWFEFRGIFRNLQRQSGRNSIVTNRKRI